MACEREQECLLYLWGEMAEGQSRDFSLHLEQCPACKGQVEAFEPLLRSMQGMAIEELPEEVAQRISSRLAEVVERRPRRVRFGPQRILAVAASIVVLVGAGILWQSITDRSPGSRALRVEETEPLLSDDEYLDALALVLISEPADAGDILTEAIEDVAYQIDELTQEIEDDFGPIEPSEAAPDKQGANRASGKVRMI